VSREPSTRRDDAVLIQASLRGDQAAFGELILRYQDRLFHAVHCVVGHSEDARDVVQEAFLSAYQSLKSFKGDSKFFTWLYRIAFNAAISQRRKRRTVVSMDALGTAGGIDPMDLSDGHQPGAMLERTEDVRRVQLALQAMTPEHRAVLVLKDIEGQKYEDIAEILDVPIGTVRSRLHRARIELRDALVRDGSA
jgi:RNA polymerase sigma-70 factor (ECF subfamily)